jgi:hypothetical protein
VGPETTLRAGAGAGCAATASGAQARAPSATGIFKDLKNDIYSPSICHFVASPAGRSFIMF